MQNNSRARLLAYVTGLVNQRSVWWLDTPDLVQLACDQQETRYEGHPWEELIGPWLENKQSTAISEVLRMYRQAAGALDADG